MTWAGQDRPLSRHPWTAPGPARRRERIPDRFADHMLEEPYRGHLADSPTPHQHAGDRIERLARWLLPVLVMAIAVAVWEAIVVWNAIPPYLLPGPGLVAETLVTDWPVLAPALANTLIVTLAALVAAVIGGVGLAVLFSSSRWVEYSFFPLAVIVQVTPIVAIFPLINIYIDDAATKILLCAWIVAFFPVLSNTTLGLNSADHNLRDLFELYGANRRQTLFLLRLPSAMPYFLAGLRIAGGLALIGSVVAEFVIGASSFGSGLTYRIIESGYRLNTPRMFAAVILISITGIIIYLILNLVTHLVLRRWHESALDRRR